MKDVLLWNLKRPADPPARLIVNDAVASAMVRAGVGAAADPREAGVLSMGAALDPGTPTWISLAAGVVPLPERFEVPLSVAQVAVAQGVGAYVDPPGTPSTPPPAGATLVAVPTAPTTRYHPNTGTASLDGNGRVASAVDIMGFADAANGAGTGPRQLTDALGRKFWRFRGSTTGGQVLTIANLLGLTSQNCAIFVVGRGFNGVIASLGIAGQSPWNQIGWARAVAPPTTGNYTRKPYCAGTSYTNTGLYIGTQMQVFGVLGRASGGGGARVGINKSASSGTAPLVGSAVNGMSIGEYAQSPNDATSPRLSADIYDILIYTGAGAMTNAQFDAIMAALADGYAIPDITHDVILDGDSITFGLAIGAEDTNGVYGEGQMARLLTDPGGPFALPATTRVINTAVSGSGMTLSAQLNPSVRAAVTDSIYNSAARIGGELGDYYIQIGVNDITSTTAQADTMLAALKTHINAASTGMLQRGCRVTIGINIANGNASKNPIILYIRTKLREAQFLVDVDAHPGGTYDGKVKFAPLDLIEVAGAKIFETQAQAANSLYYQGDGLHPVLLGNQMMLTGGDTPANGIRAALVSDTLLAVPLLAPGGAYTGVAGSGFAPGTIPEDQARVNGKAAIRILSPDGAYIGADAPEGYMFGMHAHVSLPGGDRDKNAIFRAHFEGNVYTVPYSYHEWESERTGEMEGAWGHWMKFDPAVHTVNGVGHLYAEYIPSSPDRERTVVGPLIFGRQAVLHGARAEVWPSLVGTETPATRYDQGNALGIYRTFEAAKDRMRAIGAKNPLITLMETGTYETTLTGQENLAYDDWKAGHVHVRPALGVVATFANVNYVGLASGLRPRHPMWWHAIKFDMTNIGSINGEGGSDDSPGNVRSPVFDGCEFSHALGRDYWIGGEFFGGKSLYRSCLLHDMTWGMVGDAGMIVHCVVHDIAGDATKNAPNIYGLTVYNQNAHKYNSHLLAATGVQLASASTATLSRGALNVSTWSSTWTATIDGTPTVRTFTRNENGGVLVDWLIGLGFPITPTADVDAFPACFLYMNGTMPFGPGGSQPAVNVKSSAATLTYWVDVHGDVFTQDNPEQTIITNAIGYGLTLAQHLFLADRTYQDMYIINMGVTGIPDATFFSQMINTERNVNLWHVTLLDQALWMRNYNATPWTSGKADYAPSECSIKGSVIKQLVYTLAPHPAGNIIDRNFVLDLTSLPTTATNTLNVPGTTRDDIFDDPDAANWTIPSDSPLRDPASLVPAQIHFDAYNRARPAMTTAGAVQAQP